MYQVALFVDIFTFFAENDGKQSCIQALIEPNAFFVASKFKSLSYPIYVCYYSFVILGCIGKVAND